MLQRSSPHSYFCSFEQEQYGYYSYPERCVLLGFRDIPLYIAMFSAVMMAIPISSCQAYFWSTVLLMTKSSVDILRFIYQYSFKVMDKRVLSSFIRAIIFAIFESIGVAWVHTLIWVSSFRMWHCWKKLTLKLPIVCVWRSHLIPTRLCLGGFSFKHHVTFHSSWRNRVFSW